MKVLMVIGYIIGFTIAIGLIGWIMLWCWFRTVAAFRSVFGRQK
jgi:hypothetical protein